MTKQILSAIKVSLLAISLSLSISYVYAWTAPTVTPPGGNVSVPINTSATSQYKEGTFGVGGLIRGYANAIFDGSVGIGTTSMTPWAKLEVNGNVSLTGDDGSGHSLITSEAGGKPLMLKSRAGNYPDLVVGTSGNVGVGVPDPTQKLDVAGNIKGTGLCIGTDCKTSWPTSGSTPPAGSTFLDTSATAQTKSGAITTAGLTTTNRLTVGEAGGAYTYVTLKDDESPNGVKYIHANSNVVGFLSGYGGWLSYWDNAGSQYNVGNINANDYYIRASGKWASQLGAGVVARHPSGSINAHKELAGGTQVAIGVLMGVKVK